MDNPIELSLVSATLEPPGSIAVVGAGPLGIEATLYGRYLGYDVTLIESQGVASSMKNQRQDPLPMLPDRCLSALARGALDAQAGDSDPKALPLTIGQWIDEVWTPLAESDLLRGRVRCPLEVTKIEQVEVVGDEADADSDPEEDVPPDFRLTFGDGSHDDFEAVILACGAAAEDSAGERLFRTFPQPTDYFFAIGRDIAGDGEADFWNGLKQIVTVYASLGGRQDLDLYRPQRGAE